jgi:hypothetical protein
MLHGFECGTTGHCRSEPRRLRICAEALPDQSPIGLTRGTTLTGAASPRAPPWARRRLHCSCLANPSISAPDEPSSFSSNCGPSGTTPPVKADLVTVRPKSVPLSNRRRLSPVKRSVCTPGDAAFGRIPPTTNVMRVGQPETDRGVVACTNPDRRCDMDEPEFGRLQSPLSWVRSQPAKTALLENPGRAPNLPGDRSRARRRLSLIRLAPTKGPVR